MGVLGECCCVEKDTGEQRQKERFHLEIRFE
jgi:hypothetical protein